MSDHIESHHDHNKEKKVSIVSMRNSFWLVVIIVGLFIAALNFIAAESVNETAEKPATEVQATPEASVENTSNADTKAEAPKAAEPAPASDTASKSKK